MSQNIFQKFVGFLGHHAIDLKAVGQTVETLFSKIAIDPADRGDLTTGIGRLIQSAENILDSIPALQQMAATVSHLDYAEIARNLPGEVLDAIVEAKAASLGFVKTADVQAEIASAVAAAIAVLPAPMPVDTVSVQTMGG